MLSVTLDKDAYAPGETVTATIFLNPSKPVRARSLSASLFCSMRKQVKTTKVIDKYDSDRDKEMGIPYVSHMETNTETRESVKFKQEKKVWGEKTFSAEEFIVKFTLPEDAPATSHEYGHDNTIFVWKVAAKLDIPMALDRNAEQEFTVLGL